LSNSKSYTVIDFFCGAGGFSEGFHQMGFEIIRGYDRWKPAVDTFNHNFNTDSHVKNILDFEDLCEIQSLPNTDVILGSPPCVSFSSSNRAGNSDKTLGIRLTEVYLKIVAVKKHQPNSELKAWFMENVANSKKYLKSYYTFKDLSLQDWALMHNLNPNGIAIDLRGNSEVINAADYGSFQARKRLISGEIISTGCLKIPKKTHAESPLDEKLLYRTVKEVKDNLPNPFSKPLEVLVKDPQYDIEIPLKKLSDQFYDTGVFKIEWKNSKYLKTNHPYMGKMSFPENEDKPSRTVTATKIPHSRESLIYKSELKRFGDGEFRMPTVREAATIMGFPITYQFIGPENTKWKLIGNAVCSTVSRMLAISVLESERVDIPDNLKVCKYPNLKGIPNLNTFKTKTFNSPPIKNAGAKFRRHPIKDGNLTVTLSNYNIDSNTTPDGKWRTSVQYGSGKGFVSQKVENNFYKEIEDVIKRQYKGKEFLSVINNGFSEKIGNSKLMQEMYETQKPHQNYSEPTELVEEVSSIIEKLKVDDREIKLSEEKIFLHKNCVPLSQLFALYAVNKISSNSNSERD
jgi:DNA (cytosine-5)-methyltransferase 1